MVGLVGRWNDWEEGQMSACRQHNVAQRQWQWTLQKWYQREGDDLQQQESQRSAMACNDDTITREKENERERNWTKLWQWPMTYGPWNDAAKNRTMRVTYVLWEQ